MASLVKVNWKANDQFNITDDDQTQSTTTIDAVQSSISAPSLADVKSSEESATNAAAGISGIVFINTYGSGVSAAFETAIITAENFFQSHYTGNVTLNMDFDLQPINVLYSGQNFYSPVTHVSFASLVSALTAHATTADQIAAVKSLPSADPTGGAGFDISVGMARNLGLGDSVATFDDSIILNSNLSWTFGADAVGVLEHEISEGALGRIGGLGVQNGAWGPMDLFRYSAPGQHDYSGGEDGKPTYFSVDGTTLLTQFHNSLNASGVFDGNDFADWNSTVGDAFGPTGPGSPGTVSAIDLQVMDVLGWTPIDPSDPMNFSINDTTSNTVTAVAGDIYTGPVAGLQHEIIDITTDNLNIAPLTPNVFIHSGSGMDGIDVSKVNGNNVLDGSTGSNFLIGGTGTDEFYMDDRTPSSPIFSTIVNFHSGDNATVWGVTANDFTLTLLDNQGAAGATGLDFVFSAPGHIDTSFVLAGYTSADLTNGRLSESYGKTEDLPGLPGSLYMTVHAN